MQFCLVGEYINNISLPISTISNSQLLLKPITKPAVFSGTLIQRKDTFKTVEKASYTIANKAGLYYI